MDDRLIRLLVKCRDEDSLQQLSQKLRLPLYLFTVDGHLAAYGSGKTEIQPPAPLSITGFSSVSAQSVQLFFMGELIGILYSPESGEHVEVLLSAAAHNLESAFRFETEIEDMSSEIVHVYDELSTIYSLSRKLGSEMETDEICQRAVDECQNALKVKTVVLMLMDNISGTLVLQSCIGNCVNLAQPLQLKQSSAVIRGIFERKTSTVIAEPDPDSGLPLNYPCPAVLCIPLVTDNRNIGMMIATDKMNGQEFRSQEIKLMDAISLEIAAAIKKAQLYGQINKLFMHTVEALASAIDAKDPYTYGHSRRVADYAAIICHELKLTKKEAKTIELASVLHDIGKIGTPETILQKPYRLMPEEIDKIKEHPVLGAQILCSIEELKDVIDGIRHHHERFDGNGYPDQISSGRFRSRPGLSPLPTASMP